MLRALIVGSLIGTVAATGALSQTRKVGGEWTGKYVCAQGVTGARLIMSDDGARGVFHFFPVPENPRVPEGCYQVTGVFDSVNGGLAIIPGQWYLRPRNYGGAPFSGTIDESGERFGGKINGLKGCTIISLSRAAPTRPLPSVCARGLP